MFKSEEKQECEVVDVINVRQEEEKYLVKNSVRKVAKVTRIGAKSGAEMKLSDRRVELRGSREKVEKAKEMVRAICKKTVVIHMEGEH